LDTQYRQLSIPIAPGDQLFVYTDGILDAPSPEGQSYGLDRPQDALDAIAGSPLSEIKSAVIETLNQYVQKNLTHDDVTMIALEIC